MLNPFKKFPSGGAPAGSAASFSTKTPIRTLVDNPAANEVLARELPGLTTHPRFESFKVLSLEQLKPLAGDLITSERMEQINAALAKISVGPDSTPSS